MFEKARLIEECRAALKWNPETFNEHPYDIEHTLRKFEEANERLKTCAA